MEGTKKRERPSLLLYAVQHRILECIQHADGRGEQAYKWEEGIKQNATAECLIILNYSIGHHWNIPVFLSGIQYSPFTTGPAKPVNTGPKLVKAVVPTPIFRSKESLSANAWLISALKV